MGLASGSTSTMTSLPSAVFNSTFIEGLCLLLMLHNGVDV
jgi:hypothetical protein